MLCPCETVGRVAVPTPMTEVWDASEYDKSRHKTGGVEGNVSARGEESGFGTNGMMGGRMHAGWGGDRHNVCG